MPPSQDPFYAGLGQAVRIGTELLAALSVGGGLGWVVDTYLLNSTPWGLVLGLVLLAMEDADGRHPFLGLPWTGLVGCTTTWRPSSNSAPDFAPVAASAQEPAELFRAHQAVQELEASVVLDFQGGSIQAAHGRAMQ